MEQTLNQRNNPWNRSGTSSLKALANKVLERNKKRNKPGTAPSKSVPPMPQSSIACGTNASVFQLSVAPFVSDVLRVSSVSDVSSVLDGHEERLAIAEYDGHQTSPQAQRISYLDAFVSVLVTLPQESFLESSKGDWLDCRIKEAKDWLTTQGLEQPE